MADRKRGKDSESGGKGDRTGSKDRREEKGRGGMEELMAKEGGGNRKEGGSSGGRDEDIGMKIGRELRRVAEMVRGAEGIREVDQARMLGALMGVMGDVGELSGEIRRLERKTMKLEIEQIRREGREREREREMELIQEREKELKKRLEQELERSSGLERRLRRQQRLESRRGVERGDEKIMERGGREEKKGEGESWEGGRGGGAKSEKESEEESRRSESVESEGRESWTSEGSEGGRGGEAGKVSDREMGSEKGGSESEDRGIRDEEWPRLGGRGGRRRSKDEGEGKGRQGGKEEGQREGPNIEGGTGWVEVRGKRMESRGEESGNGGIRAEGGQPRVREKEDEGGRREDRRGLVEEEGLMVRSMEGKNERELMDELVGKMKAKEIGGPPLSTRPVGEGRVLIVPRDREQWVKIREKLKGMRGIEVRESRRGIPLVMVSGVEVGTSEREIGECLLGGRGGGI